MGPAVTQGVLTNRRGQKTSFRTAMLKGQPAEATPTGREGKWGVEEVLQPQVDCRGDHHAPPYLSASP